MVAEMLDGNLGVVLFGNVIFVLMESGSDCVTWFQIQESKLHHHAQ